MRTTILICVLALCGGCVLSPKAATKEGDAKVVQEGVRIVSPNIEGKLGKIGDDADTIEKIGGDKVEGPQFNIFVGKQATEWRNYVILGVIGIAAFLFWRAHCYKVGGQVTSEAIEHFKYGPNHSVGYLLDCLKRAWAKRGDRRTQEGVSRSALYRTWNKKVRGKK